MSSIQSNIWKLYLYKAARGFMLVMPTMVLFFQENGLSMQQVFLLQTFFSVAIFALEIPSGYFADTFGRKNSIVIGTVLGFFAFATYSISYGFWPMVLAETLLGFGFAFISGADSALMYETLVAGNETQTYRKREGRMQFSLVASEAVGSIVGGYLALISLRTPMYAETVLFFLMIFIALSLREVGWQKGAIEKKVWTMRKVLVHSFFENMVLRSLILYYALINTIGLIIVWFRQPYFVELGIGIEMFGYLWAILMIVVSISNLSADRFERLLGSRVSLTSIAGLAIASSILIAFDITYWGLLAIALFCVVRGLTEPIVAHHIQRFAISEVRATMLSLRGFAARGMFAVAGPIAGWASDVYSLQFALIASGVIFAVLMVPTLVFVLRSERMARGV